MHACIERKQVQIIAKPTGPKTTRPRGCTRKRSLKSIWVMQANNKSGEMNSLISYRLSRSLTLITTFLHLFPVFNAFAIRTGRLHSELSTLYQVDGTE